MPKTFEKNKPKDQQDLRLRKIQDSTVFKRYEFQKGTIRYFHFPNLEYHDKMVWAKKFMSLNYIYTMQNEHVGGLRAPGPFINKLVMKAQPFPIEEWDDAVNHLKEGIHQDFRQLSAFWYKQYKIGKMKNILHTVDFRIGSERLKRNLMAYGIPEDSAQEAVAYCLYTRHHKNRDIHCPDSYLENANQIRDYIKVSGTKLFYTKLVIWWPELYSKDVIEDNDKKKGNELELEESQNNETDDDEGEPHTKRARIGGQGQGGSGPVEEESRIEEIFDEDDGNMSNKENEGGPSRPLPPTPTSTEEPTPPPPQISANLQPQIPEETDEEKEKERLEKERIQDERFLTFIQSLGDPDDDDPTPKKKVDEKATEKWQLVHWKKYLLRELYSPEINEVLSNLRIYYGKIIKGGPYYLKLVPSLTEMFLELLRISLFKQNWYQVARALEGMGNEAFPGSVMGYYRHWIFWNAGFLSILRFEGKNGLAKTAKAVKDFARFVNLQPHH